MKTSATSLIAIVLGLCISAAAHAQPMPTGKYVKVWLLEVKYQANGPWTQAGKYDSLASAQQSYTVRARHGGYSEMRIRETVEWRSNLRALAARQSPSFSKLIQATK